MKTTLVEFRRGSVEIHTSGSEEEMDARFHYLSNQFNCTHVSSKELEDDMEFFDNLEPEETFVFGIIKGNFEFDIMNDEDFDILKPQNWVKMSYC